MDVAQRCSYDNSVCRLRLENLQLFFDATSCDMQGHLHVVVHHGGFRSLAHQNDGSTRIRMAMVDRNAWRTEKRTMPGVTSASMRKKVFGCTSSSEKRDGCVFFSPWKESNAAKTIC